MRIFRDRYEAGRLLGEDLARYAGRDDVVVLGLARGGVPVAFEVARRLQAPFDVCIVHKLGVPFQPELAMGAVAAGGPVVVNREVTRSFGISDAFIESAAREEKHQIFRREGLYRDGRAPRDLAGRTVILVDDGLATGAIMIAAVRAVRNQKPARIVVAAPVGAPSTVEGLEKEANEVVCVTTPEAFYAVGHWYDDFSPTTDEDVRTLLSNDEARRSLQSSESSRPIERSVSILADGTRLNGDLIVPAGARGLVMFAHGSGSSRHSPRNRFVAETLREAGHGTLLMDLLTEKEEERERATVGLRFDIDLLARRLIAVTDWAADDASTKDLPIGYFGASTGAAAALVAAAQRPQQIATVVSRGGRPDLARSELSNVRAPTLLIVGRDDPIVLELNRDAYRQLHSEKRLAIVPHATHLFEEPGALERVAELTRDWFEEHLGTGPSSRPTRAAQYPAPSH